MIRHELRGLAADRLRYWAIRLLCWAQRLDPDESRAGPLVAAHEDSVAAFAREVHEHYDRMDDEAAAVAADSQPEGILAPALRRARIAVEIAQAPGATDDEVTEAVLSTLPFRHLADCWQTMVLERAWSFDMRRRREQREAMVAAKDERA